MENMISKLHSADINARVYLCCSPINMYIYNIMIALLFKQWYPTRLGFIEQLDDQP